MVYTVGLSYEQFLGDEKTIDAVIRNFEIIGEAANRLPEEIRDQHPNIDWHRIRGFRNRITEVRICTTDGTDAEAAFSKSTGWFVASVAYAVFMIGVFGSLNMLL